MRAHSSRMLVLTAFAVTIGVAGCASGGGGTSSRPAGSSSTVIVQEELAPLGRLSALEAIQRLRPQWLRTRGGGDPVLYIDGTRRQGLNELTTMTSGDVGRMEFLSSTDASNRYGTGHQDGAILVSTRR